MASMQRCWRRETSSLPNHLIRCKPQPFRIYKITTPIDGKAGSSGPAYFLSAQLYYSFPVLSEWVRRSGAGAEKAMRLPTVRSQFGQMWHPVRCLLCPFRHLSETVWAVWMVRYWILFGGEFEWDRYTVKFHRARGADHNVHIVYGKNLTDFKMEKSIENTITGVHPYWVDNETQAVMELPEKVVMVSRKSVPYQKITVLDCTSAFQEKPSEAALREYAQDYIDTTSLTEPEIDIKIDFIQLWNTPGYEDVVQAEQVSLCDTVHVYISKLGIEASSKVTETEYDSLWNGITASRCRILRSAAEIPP